ncbi:MAG: hypothetical protein WD076_05070 [Parvularculaceae bacterium]
MTPIFGSPQEIDPNQGDERACGAKWRTAYAAANKHEVFAMHDAPMIGLHMWGISAVWALAVLVLLLGAAALIKYLFFKK